MRPTAQQVLLAFAATGLTIAEGLDYHNLPNETQWPGPWDDYIKAPANKSYITPERIWKVEGNVTTSGLGSLLDAGHLLSGKSILIGEGGLLTLKFDENIAGRVCFEVESVADEPVLYIAYSESSFFAGAQTDATNDEEFDLPLEFHVGNRTGSMCVGSEFIRGGFQYLTLFIEDIPVFHERDKSSLGQMINSVTNAAQRVLGLSSPTPPETLGEKEPYSKPSVGIKRLWVDCTAFPSQSNGRAYSGYFYSSSSLLNRIWYAGAYTLQLSTIDPKEGSALILANRYLDHNESPPGAWYSNFTVSKGTTVTTDGAKRDRLVWPGDMYIAIPGIAMSTYDMLAVRNALDILYERQYSDGRLPYAGPPLSYQDEFSDTYHLHTLLGTYDYILYTGDMEWLRQKWPAYLRALRVSTDKIDSKDLMYVTSRFDWNRWGMGGHNIEANAILYTVLQRSIELASFLEEDDTSTGAQSTTEHTDTAFWHKLRLRLKSGAEPLFCDSTGLYADNLQDRHCAGPDHVDPQDGNAWALIAKLQDTSSSIPLTVSQGLRARWNAFGAPSPEFPNVMSPFSSSFELQGHCAAGKHDTAIELMLLMWGYLLDGPGFTNSTLAEGYRTDGYVGYPAYPPPSRNSHAHGWSAGPTSVLMGQILGITLVKPSGREWVVRPVLTKWLSSARGGFAINTGSFEVRMKRILLVSNESDSGIVKRGTVAVVKGPDGSRGRFRWGDEDESSGFQAEMVGGETRAWVRWEDTNDTSSPTGATTVELHIKDGAWAQRTDDKWFEGKIPYGDSELVYDHTFKEPVMEEREPGVVDFELLKEGYAKSRNWLL